MKRIDMQYPYDPSFNPLYDGEVHPIIPNSFVPINIHGMNCYIMIYFDTYGTPAPMITLITQVGERFVKVPLNDLAYDYLHVYVNEHRREARVNPPEGLGNFIGLAMPMTLSDREILEASPILDQEELLPNVSDRLKNGSSSVFSAVKWLLPPSRKALSFGTPKGPSENYATVPNSPERYYEYEKPKQPKPKKRKAETFDVQFYVPLDKNDNMLDINNVYRGGSLSKYDGSQYHFYKEGVYEEFLSCLMVGSKLYHSGHDCEISRNSNSFSINSSGEMIHDYELNASGVKEYVFTVDVPENKYVKKTFSLGNGKYGEYDMLVMPGKYRVTGYYSNFNDEDYERSVSSESIDVLGGTGLYNGSSDAPKVFRDAGSKKLQMIFNQKEYQKR